jgi:hypothetical protein
VVRRKKNIVEKRLYLACLSLLDKHNPQTVEDERCGLGDGKCAAQQVLPQPRSSLLSLGLTTSLEI